MNANTERILSSTELWFSAPSTFNDLHECCFTTPLKVLSETDVDLQRNWWRICCFAGVKDDLLMWSHYADHHRGVCFGFSVDEKDIYDLAAGNNSGKYHRVLYPENDMLPSVCGATNKERIDDYVKVLCTKSQHWKYEKEVRMLLHPSWPDMMKYTTTGVPVRFAPEFLTHVYLGARISQADQNSVIKLLLSRSNSVELFKARRHPLKYAVEFDYLGPTNGPDKVDQPSRQTVPTTVDYVVPPATLPEA